MKSWSESFKKHVTEEKHKRKWACEICGGPTGGWYCGEQMHPMCYEAWTQGKVVRKVNKK